MLCRYVETAAEHRSQSVAGPSCWEEPALCLLSQPHLETTPHTVKAVEQVLWYISICCTPACASFPFHQCDRPHPCKAPVVIPPHLRTIEQDGHLKDVGICRRPFLNRSKGHSHLQSNIGTNEPHLSSDLAATEQQLSMDLISIDCFTALWRPGLTEVL